MVGIKTLFTVKEAAAYVTVSESTIRREIDAGKLRAVKVRGCIRILRVDLFSYLGMEPENDPARNWDAELLGSSHGDDSHTG